MMSSIPLTSAGLRGQLLREAQIRGVMATPFFGGLGSGGAIRVTLNNIISKIGWDHLIREPPRGGPTAYQN